MDINRIGQLPAISKGLPLPWQPGQHLQIEVITITGAGEGIILLDGQLTPALLETSVKPGDKFGVTVREINDGTLLLVRDAANDPKVSFGNQDYIKERGFPLNEQIEKLLQNFPEIEEPGITLLAENKSESIPPQLNKVRDILRQIIPEWNTLNSENGPQQFLHLAKTLGLDLEYRLRQSLKQNNLIGEPELENLRETVKSQILSLLQNEKNPLPVVWRERLQQALQELTAQQFWVHTGSKETAFVLFQFPLQNQGNFFNVRIAIESSRKGTKMDFHHSHIALSLETPNLGTIGVDAWFFNERVNLKVLSSEPNELLPLIDEVMPITKEQFSKIGFYLNSVETGPWDPHIQRFIKGERLNGVDIQL